MCRNMILVMLSPLWAIIVVVVAWHNPYFRGGAVKIYKKICFISLIPKTETGTVTGQALDLMTG